MGQVFGALLAPPPAGKGLTPAQAEATLLTEYLGNLPENWNTYIPSYDNWEVDRQACSRYNPNGFKVPS